MPWWLWVLIGLGLLLLEMTTPGGFFAIFFGIGAVVVGILAALGWAGPAWVQWLLFSLLSLIGLLLFRRPLMRMLKLSGVGRPVDSLVGEAVLVLEDVPPGGVGKAEMRGSAWNARIGGGAALSKGQRGRVERVEGLTLWIRPD